MLRSDCSFKCLLISTDLDSEWINSTARFCKCCSLLMSEVPQLPLTTLQYLSLDSTRFLYMVSIEDFGRNLTCLIENKAEESFYKVCQHVYPILIDRQLLHPIAQPDRPSQYCDPGCLY